jgi:hypothetical protein
MLQRLLLPILILFCIGTPHVSANSRLLPEGTGTQDSIAPSAEAVSRAIALATGYLERACGKDGKFVYLVDTGSGRESKSYDIIRHAGAMYALAMANHSHPDPEIIKAMVRAASFLREHYVGPGPQSGQLAVWSRPLNHRAPAKGDYAELGGTGLGLVALTAVRQSDPKLVPIQELQALGQFLLYLQKDDGSFVQKYSPERGPIPNWGVLYYPGEAALGWIGLYEMDHSNRWLAAAAKALSFLAKSRLGQTAVPADHWALIATAALMPYSDQIQSVISRNELVRHAAQICNSIVHEQFRGAAAIGMDGAFDSGGRTAPAATRIEGLLAALEFLPKDELHQRVQAATDRGVAFLLRAQLTSGKYTGGLTGSVRTSELDSSAVRTDYVQHALCALLRHELMIQRERRSRGD